MSFHLQHQVFLLKQLAIRLHSVLHTVPLRHSRAYNKLLAPVMIDGSAKASGNVRCHAIITCRRARSSRGRAMTLRQ